MNCKIISPDKSLDYGEVKSVTLPGLSGEAEILPGHAELFMELGRGSAILQGDQTVSVPVTDGVCHIKDEEIVIIL